MSILALWLKRGFLGAGGGGAPPGPTPEIEILARSGAFIISRSGAQIIGR